jgi:hypothetical protein
VAKSTAGVGPDTTPAGEEDTHRLRNGKRAKQIPFAWCLDGNHSKCRTSYLCDFGVHAGKVVTCICPCHLDGPCDVCGDPSAHYQGLTRCRASESQEASDEESSSPDPDGDDADGLWDDSDDAGEGDEPDEDSDADAGE